MLENLTTESRNPASEQIDTLSALEIVRLMNAEDAGISAAVARESERVAQAVEIIAERLHNGGRLIYLGAGTSGRLGVLDAAECPPTFNTPPEMVIGLIAGGPAALTRAVEGAEDHPELAIADLDSAHISDRDVVVGIASSGRTPYVIGGLQHARRRKAVTIGISCNAEPELAAVADLMISLLVGPEVISGSTRLKAGTATKLVLNMLTTGAMVRLGKTFGNLMVDLRATNRKLLERTRRIVMLLTGLTADSADELLTRCAGELKTAVVAHRRAVEPDEARQLLARSRGHLRQALEIPRHEDRSIENAATSPAAVVSHGTSTEIKGTDPDGKTELVLGIDGGGSKTIAWLARRGASGDWAIIGRGASGPSNPQAVAFTTAFANLDAAINGAFQNAACPVQTVTAACAALAGSGRELDQQRLREWASHRSLAEKLELVPDALPLLAAGTPEGWGVALIAGTGSLAFGRNAAGVTARAGGWGYLLGDEGSGYAIARHGLQAAAKAADGRGQATELLARFLQYFQARHPQEIISRVYRPEIDRPTIAALSHLVFETACAGDLVAKEILIQGARELASAVAAVASQLDLAQTAFPLAVGGGLLVHNQTYREALDRELKALRLQVLAMNVVRDPVVGTVLLAQRSVA